MNKRILSIFSSVSLLFIYLVFTSYDYGYTGVSTVGCGNTNCHGSISTATIISFAGFPANYVNGQAYSITATVTNTSKVAAGFDLNVSAGTLSNAPTGSSLNGTTEIYHTTPNSMTSGVASWTFTWTAPATGSATVTCNMAGNAVNLSGTSSGDAWSLGSTTIAGPVANVTVTATASTVLCNGGTSTITTTGASGTSPYQYKINSGSYQSTNTFSGNLAGTYTITIKDANNVTATTAITISQPSALLSTASATGTTCSGSSNGTGTVIATGGIGNYTYAWLPSGGTTLFASNLSSGTYTCTITDANSCTTTKSVTVTASTVIVNPNFTVAGNTLTALQTSATAYQWLKCLPNLTPITNNGNAATYTISASGSYALIVANGTCIDTSACMSVIALGMNNVASEANFLTTLPYNKYVYTNTIFNNFNYQIYNTQGVKVAMGIMKTGENNLDLNNFTSGIYLLQVNNKVYKLIVK